MICAPQIQKIAPYLRLSFNTVKYSYLAANILAALLGYTRSETIMNVCRLLTSEDAPQINILLKASTETTLFIQSNLIKAGVDYTGQDFGGEYYGLFDCGQLAALLVHCWNHNMMAHSKSRGYLKALCDYFNVNAQKPVGGFIGAMDQVDGMKEYIAIQAEYEMNSAKGLYSLHLSDLVDPTPAFKIRHNNPVVEFLPVRDVSETLLYDWMKAYNIEALKNKNGPELDKTVHADVVRMQKGDYSKRLIPHPRSYQWHF